MLSTTLIAPTSTKVRPAVFRPEIEIDGTPTRVLVEQTTVIDDEKHLGEFTGKLSTEELGRLNDALLIVLGLD